MSAAGISPARLLRPFLWLSTLVFFLVAAIYVEVMPWSFDAIQQLSSCIHADFITNFARPGAFNELDRLRFPLSPTRKGRLAAWRLHARPPRPHTSRPTSLKSANGQEGREYLSRAVKGTYQRPEASGDSAIVTFDDYAIDLSQFMHKADIVKRPRERSTKELLTYQRMIEQERRLAGRLRGELTDPFSSPLYAFAAGLIGFAALGEARTTRQGRGVAITSAVLIFAALRMLGVAVISLTVERPPRHDSRLDDADCGQRALPRLDLRRTGEAGACGARRRIAARGT